MTPTLAVLHMILWPNVMLTASRDDGLIRSIPNKVYLFTSTDRGASGQHCIWHGVWPNVVLAASPNWTCKWCWPYARWLYLPFSVLLPYYYPKQPILRTWIIVLAYLINLLQHTYADDSDSSIHTVRVWILVYVRESQISSTDTVSKQVPNLPYLHVGTHVARDSLSECRSMLVTYYCLTQLLPEFGNFAL